MLDTVLNVDVQRVGLVVKPCVAFGIAHAVEVLVVAAVVDRQVEGNHRVATPLVLQGEGGLVGRGGVVDTVQVPNIVVASRDGLNAGVLIVDGEVHRNNAVATLGGSQGVGIGAADGVGLAADRPGVAVAHDMLKRRGSRMVDREVQVVLHGALAAVVDIGKRGGLGGGDGLAAPGHLGTLADLAVGVLNTHLLEGEVQVHQAVAAVSNGEVLVIVAVGGNGHVAPSVRIVDVADAHLHILLIGRIDRYRSGVEVVDATVLVGDRDGVGTGRGSGGGGNSGGGTGAPLVGVALNGAGGQGDDAVAANLAHRSSGGDHRQRVDRDGVFSRNGAGAGVVGGSGDSVGRRLGGVHRDAGGGGTVAPAVGGVNIVGVGDGERGALAVADLGVATDGQGGHRRGGDGQRGRQAGAARRRVGGDHGVGIRLVRIDHTVGSSALVVPDKGGGGLITAGYQSHVEVVAVVVDLGDSTVVVIDTHSRGRIDLQVEDTDRVGTIDALQGHSVVARSGVGLAIELILVTVADDHLRITQLVGGVHREVEVTVDAVEASHVDHRIGNILRAVGSSFEGRMVHIGLAVAGSPSVGAILHDDILDGVFGSQGLLAGDQELKAGVGESVVGIGREDQGEVAAVNPEVAAGHVVDAVGAGVATNEVVGVDGAAVDIQEVVAVLQVIVTLEASHVASLSGTYHVGSVQVASITTTGSVGHHKLVAGNDRTAVVGQGVHLLTQFDGQVVHIDVVGSRGAVDSLEGHIAGAAGILAEGDLVESLSGIAGRRSVDSLNRDEGLGIGRVAHHTHSEGRAGIAEAGIEANFEGVEVETELGQDGNLVAIGGGSGCVEAQRVGRAVRIGSSAVDAGQTHVGGVGTQVEVAPAVGHPVVGHSAAGITGVAVEVLHEGHIGILPYTALRGAGGHSTPIALIGGAAEGTDIELILPRVVQAGHLEGGVVGGLHLGAVVLRIAEAFGAVAHLPARGVGGDELVVGPAQGGAGLRGGADGQVNGHPAGGIGGEAGLGPGAIFVVVGITHGAHIDVIVGAGGQLGINSIGIRIIKSGHKHTLGLGVEALGAVLQLKVVDDGAQVGAGSPSHGHNIGRSDGRCRHVGSKAGHAGIARTDEGNIGTQIGATAGSTRYLFGGVLAVVFTQIHATVDRRGSGAHRIETRVALVDTSGLVHKVGDNDVANTVPNEGVLEVILYSARGIQRVRSGGINQRLLTQRHPGSSALEGGLLGLTHIDGKLLGIRGIVGPSEGNGCNFTSLQAGSSQLFSSINLLAITVTIVTIQGRTISAAVASLTNSGAAAIRADGAEGVDVAPLAVLNGGALGADVDIIVGIDIQAGQLVAGSGAHSHSGALGLGVEAGRAVLQSPIGGGGVGALGPGDHSGAVGHIAGSHIDGAVAVGDLTDGNVVNTTVGCCAIVAGLGEIFPLERKAGTRRGIGRQGREI